MLLLKLSQSTNSTTKHHFKIPIPIFKSWIILVYSHGMITMGHNSSCGENSFVLRPNPYFFSCVTLKVPSETQRPSVEVPSLLPSPSLPGMASPGHCSQGSDSAQEDHLPHGRHHLPGHYSHEGRGTQRIREQLRARSRAVPEGKPLFTEGKSWP